MQGGGATNPDPSFAATAFAGQADSAPAASGATGGRGAPIDGAFIAQAAAQDAAVTAAALSALPTPRQAAAAYQSTQGQSAPASSAEVLLPGMSVRAGSGRAVDFRT